MELITAVNSNLNNKNNILYCPPGLLCPFLHCKALRTAMYKRYINSIIIIIIIIIILLTKCCFTGHSTNVRRMIPLKWASLPFPYRIRAQMKRKMGRNFGPLLTASLTMTIPSRKLYPTKENSKPYISLGSREVTYGQSSRSSDRTLDKCVPRFRCIPLHSMHISAPRFSDAQSGSGNEHTHEHWLLTLQAPISRYKFSKLISIHSLTELVERACLQIKAFSEG